MLALPRSGCLLSHAWFKLLIKIKGSEIRSRSLPHAQTRDETASIVFRHTVLPAMEADEAQTRWVHSASRLTLAAAGWLPYYCSTK
jgi:hypothetical protein